MRCIMKRIISIYVCLFVVFVFCACGNNSEVELRTGGYYAEENYLKGDFEEMMEPRIYINTAEKTFSYSTSPFVSYVEHGTYEIKDNKLIATTQTATYEFEIKDSSTLVFVGNGSEDPKIPIGTRFVFAEE